MLPKTVTAVVVALLAALLTCSPGAVAPASAAGGTDRTGPVTVRVLQFNIRFGSYGLEGVARSIERTGADVVLLNEVDVQTRPGGLHQARWLARRLGMDFRYDANIRFRWGVRGNAVLTRHRISEVERFDLHEPRGSRPRGLMRVRLTAGGVAFDAWTSHLTTGAGKLRQARDVAARIGDPSCATVLGIDLNGAPGSPFDRAVRTHLQDVWRETQQPRAATNFRQTKRIDYLYTDEVTPRAAWLTPLRHSDHRGVVGVLRIPRTQAC